MLVSWLLLFSPPAPLLAADPPPLPEKPNFVIIYRRSEPAAGSDKLRIRARLAADATMSLQVNDHPAVTGQAHGLIPKQPAEEFCVGHDSLNPVTIYGSREPFHGSITELKIEYPK